jgi:hypothetical protein
MKPLRKFAVPFEDFVLVTALVLAPAAVGRAVTIGPPVQIGTISASVLPEVSGIVDGRATPGTFWVHNDSGDSARFYAINHQGSLLGTFPLTGAPSGDWEDIEIGAKPGGGNYLYLGDVGDNDANRPSITIYRTVEPQTTASATIAASDYSAAHLQYPTGARNAESLLVDPLTNDAFIITKTNIPEIYTFPGSAFGNSMTTMTALGTLSVTIPKPTAADISPDGRHILVRSKGVGYLFERSTGESVADALHGPGTSFTLGSESQGEAIGWAADGTGFFTTSELNGLPSAPIYHYSFTPSLLPGDYNRNGVVDAADFVVWQENVGTIAGTLPNDTAGGTIGQAQYDLWQSSFGATSSGSGSRSDSVSTSRVPGPPGMHRSSQPSPYSEL